MISTVTANPAALLTANKVPYALGLGRLGDSGITFDPAANGNITLTPNGTGKVITGAIAAAASGSAGSLFLDSGTHSPGTVTMRVRNGGNTLVTRMVINDDGTLRLSNTTAEIARLQSSGALCLGTSTDSSNGRVQLVSHSALGGGLAFSAVADGTETIWRHSAGVIRTGGNFRSATLTVDGAAATGALTVTGDASISGALTVGSLAGAPQTQLSKAAAYALVAADVGKLVFLAAGSGAAAFTLPAATAGYWFDIMAEDNGTAALTVQRAGADTITANSVTGKTSVSITAGVTVCAVARFTCYKTGVWAVMPLTASTWS